MECSLVSVKTFFFGNPRNSRITAVTMFCKFLESHSRYGLFCTAWCITETLAFPGETRDRSAFFSLLSRGELFGGEINRALLVGCSSSGSKPQANRIAK